ncbi:MAG: zinc ribbon domain-containing protein, partial [Nitrospinaceae bacterium]|nr:zinc ribbon domain-containing protein [Nitrospinaceae bacterium]NIR56972.1 zinc ribbon domain-containing protein [Nitrospinaceae bacterium]NIS87429.1 zinc ribbon domain-containing protein [Nitrospinaceae bacterium]NIT84278.1 zinc ribbon domain-containing protein [Nitrospinaceae bacterium]NIU46468.1 zinc ribbon domain-containing protein [Nitrospinaceae bacterium]
LQSVSANKEESRCSECGSSKVRPKMSTFSSKVTGMTSKTASPVTAKDLPNTKIFDLPKPRHVSEYQN